MSQVHKLTLKDTQDRFTGCLLGVAIGDAMGAPLEELVRSYIKKCHGTVTEYLDTRGPAGLVTDDTEMSIAQAESLIACKGYDLDDTARRFAEWFKDADFFGLGTASACARLLLGKSPLESGDDSPGNGAAMRVAPLGLLYSSPDKGWELKKSVQEASAITHQNDIAISGAVAISRAVAYNVQHSGHFDRIDFLDRVADSAACFNDDMACRINRLDEYISMPEEYAIGEIGTTGYALHSVPFAIYCFLKSPYDFKATIIRAANAGDDADTNASMAGALSGALNGTGDIPQDWIDDLKYVKYEATSKRPRFLPLGTRIQTMSKQLFKLYRESLPPVGC